ncbi:hypothetical protein AKJ16_DCAP05201 [Drosera capensis]
MCEPKQQHKQANQLFLLVIARDQPLGAAAEFTVVMEGASTCFSKSLYGRRVRSSGAGLKTVVLHWAQLIGKSRSWSYAFA